MTPVTGASAAPLLPAPRRTAEGAVGGAVAGVVGGAVAPPLRERPRRRPRRAGAVVVLLLAALVAVLALAVHQRLVSGSWRERAEAAEAQRARLAATSVELQHRIDGLQADLDASDARVEQLAAEKARATDLREAGAQRSQMTAGRS